MYLTCTQQFTNASIDLQCNGTFTLSPTLTSTTYHYAICASDFILNDDYVTCQNFISTNNTGLEAQIGNNILELDSANLSSNVLYSIQGLTNTPITQELLGIEDTGTTGVQTLTSEQYAIITTEVLVILSIAFAFNFLARFILNR